MFGDILKKLRLEKGLTQSELAKILNTSASSIGMYEQNRRIPDVEILGNIAAFFDVSVDYIIGKSNNREKLISRQSKESVPVEFTNSKQAREYISRHDIFGSNGFRPDLMTDEEILEFANELLRQMEMVSFKYRK